MPKKTSGGRTPLDEKGKAKKPPVKPDKKPREKTTKEESHEEEEYPKPPRSPYAPLQYGSAEDSLRSLAFGVPTQPNRLTRAVPTQPNRLTRAQPARIPPGVIRGWKKAFVDALKKCANVSMACKVAGIDRSTAYQARENCKLFAKEWDDSVEEGIDLVEAAAFKSAVYGDLEPVFSKDGIYIGDVVKYSDAMRTLLLKGRRAQVFRDRVEHSGEIREHLTIEQLKERMKEAKQ